jgi:dihydrodipicolinate synthase/N-acetylneuraminate lyase
MASKIFTGMIPALMTPCTARREPDFDALVRKGKELIGLGMSAVVYCGSMGDWPLLSDEQRKEGVERLVKAGLPVVVGCGAQSPARAASFAEHAKKVGASGVMIIPRVLSRRKYRHLVGFKEFGGAAALRYAAEHIAGADPDVMLTVGVDTQVVHGYVNCGAVGAITGVGNVLPREVLQLEALSKKAAAGDVKSLRLANELDRALGILSSYDEGPDLVLFYKYMMVLEGNAEYELHFCPTDALSASQKAYTEQQLKLFKAWYRDWSMSVE